MGRAFAILDHLEAAEEGPDEIEWTREQLARAFDEDQSPRAERFWFRHDQVEQVKRWADIVGADRTYVVVIPDGDRTAIFTAFEGLLDLPQGFLAGREQIIQNRSMTTPEAEFVRRLNKELAGQMSWDEYTVMVRRAMILNRVEKRRPAADEIDHLRPI